MGTKMAPVDAGIFMDDLDTTFMQEQQLKPILWKRYIDDVFYGVATQVRFIGFLSFKITTFPLPGPYQKQQLPSWTLTSTKDATTEQQDSWTPRRTLIKKKNVLSLCPQIIKPSFLYI